MPVSRRQVVFVAAVWEVAICSGEFRTSETVTWFATHVKKTRRGGAASRTCGKILKCSEPQGGRLDPRFIAHMEELIEER